MDGSTSVPITDYTKNYLMAFLETPLFIFHITVIVFILAKIMKKDVNVRGSFYVLFLITAIGDTIFVIIDFVNFRLPGQGFLVEFIVYSSFSNETTKYAYAISSFADYYDTIAHFLYSVNRCTAVFMPFRYNRIWHGRNLLIIMIPWLLIPLSLVTIIFPQKGHVSRNSNGTLGFTFENPHIQIIYIFLHPLLYIPVSIIQCCIEVSTWIRYRKITYRLTSQQKNQYMNDIQLFIHSVLMSLCQFLLIVYCVLQAYAVMYSNPILQSACFRSYRWIRDAIVYGNPILLLIVNSNLRKCYVEFYILSCNKLSAVSAISASS